ncbi:MAG: SRPBCC family protein [Spirochaetaceae bacterium]|nr:SRPBCC family protein [Spirochaetaceae bacterium]
MEKRNEDPRARWIGGERVERLGRFALDARADDVFPLLCPIKEYDWLPGWSCEMVYSASGVAEKDAVFRTRERLGHKAVWTTITYEPPLFIEYLVVMGLGAVMRLGVRLRGEGPGTEVEWSMRFTTFSAVARRVVAARFSEAAFGKMMADRERELGAWLRSRARA